MAVFTQFFYGLISEFSFFDGFSLDEPSISFLSVFFGLIFGFFVFKFIFKMFFRLLG